jgi:hypothetical protein
MFIFGIAMTGTLWIYWTLHTGPFRPFQDALAAEIPHSVPRVEGGQHKMHKGTPHVLRVTLRVEFDPVRETTKGEKIVDRVEKIAARFVDLSQYDVLQVFLYHGVPEKSLLQKEYTRNLKSQRT